MTGTVVEHGVVRWFREDLRYGFVDRDAGGQVFLHAGALKRSGVHYVEEGDRVAFATRVHRGRTEISTLTLVSGAGRAAGPG